MTNAPQSHSRASNRHACRSRILHAGHPLRGASAAGTRHAACIHHVAPPVRAHHASRPAHPRPPRRPARPRSGFLRGARVLGAPSFPGTFLGLGRQRLLAQRAGFQVYERHPSARRAGDHLGAAVVARRQAHVAAHASSFTPEARRRRPRRLQGGPGARRTSHARNRSRTARRIPPRQLPWTCRPPPRRRTAAPSPPR